MFRGKLFLTFLDAYHLYKSRKTHMRCARFFFLFNKGFSCVNESIITF